MKRAGDVCNSPVYFLVFTGCWNSVGFDDDFQGFLNDLQDWEVSFKGKDKKLKPQAIGKEKEDRRQTEKASAADYLKQYDAVNRLSRNFQTEQSFVDAASEKEQGNEYFKQKKFKEAIDCYSRSIALSPTAVAFANRAMAYLKIRRQEAEDDCTEALNLDDRYIKAYSRRATARKELGKAKEALEDAEFAQRLEPNNQEIKKQHADLRAFVGKAILEKASGASRSSPKDKKMLKKSDSDAKIQDIPPVSSSTSRTGLLAARERVEENGGENAVKTSARVEENEDISTRAEIACKKVATNGFHKDSSSYLWALERDHLPRKPELKASVQELASQAASRSMVEAAKNIIAPTTAYQFEVSWRGFSDDQALQACLLKTISPAKLPQIFKNALTAPILIDIVKCVATFFTEEPALAISFLENLVKVPRFSILMMCLSSSEKFDLLKIWDEVFCDEAVPIEYAEMLDSLRSKYFLKQ
ncbi:RNA polymerase II-associated protein 3 isoform X1 [Cucumis melo var. makuwa]|uniref:RNA polymerase II-associated protein 3 isoform X1 n=1 Tax=Cucumis melo var. makuwa TaxID=1194695 RepID=A0A5A7TYG9_CUCMM|nr:RNA polymerase II-associated protein 3 isoform X1 [Cucumis melo var. makuwa]